MGCPETGKDVLKYAYRHMAQSNSNFQMVTSLTQSFKIATSETFIKQCSKGVVPLRFDRKVPKRKKRVKLFSP